MAKTMRKLVGIEAKMAQYEQGEKFIHSVEEARGRDYLDQVWGSAALVPTLAEIRDPQRWMTRIDQHAGSRSGPTRPRSSGSGYPDPNPQR